ncbi:MAG: hypothetical protein ABIQ09_15185 [Jatrophihabitantaceae bacterium]
MNIIGELIGEVVHEVAWRTGRGIRAGVIRVFGRRPTGLTEEARSTATRWQTA